MLIWLVHFNAGKTQSVSIDWSKNTGAIDVKMESLFLSKNYLLRCWSPLSLLNLTGALTLFLLLNLYSGKLEPWFVLWSFFLLRLLCISINLPYGYVWNTIVMFDLVLPVATSNCWKSYKNGYAGLLLLHLLPLLNPQLIVVMYPAKVFSIGLTWVDVHLLVVLIDSYGLFVTIPRCYKDFNSFFPHTAGLWNSVPT